MALDLLKSGSRSMKVGAKRSKSWLDQIVERSVRNLAFNAQIIDA
jgi:hypothetical protein